MYLKPSKFHNHKIPQAILCYQQLETQSKMSPRNFYQQKRKTCQLLQITPRRANQASRQRHIEYQLILIDSFYGWKSVETNTQIKLIQTFSSLFGRFFAILTTVSLQCGK